MGSKLKNVTFSLPMEVVDKLRELVKDKYIASLNAGVKDAIEEYTRRLEKEKFRLEMEKASKDPMFIKDIEEAMYDFEKSDVESAGRTE